MPRRKRKKTAPVEGSKTARRTRKVRKKAPPARSLKSVHEISAELGMKAGAAQVVKAATRQARGVSARATSKSSSPAAAGGPALLPLLDLGRDNLVRATMVCRPSKRNRSPYVADVRLAGAAVPSAWV